MENYNICFDASNSNAIIVRDSETNRILNIIACPPIDSGCDVIGFGDSLCEGYTFDFSGFVLITSPEKRELYHIGKLITETKRK